MILSSRPTLLVSASLWLALACYGVYFLFTIKNRVNFGIDLVGGTYVTLQVELDKAVENELADKIQYLSKLLERDKIISSQPVFKVEGETGIVTFESEDSASKAYNLCQTGVFQDFITSRSGKILKLNLTQKALRILKHDAIEGNINILRSRLDAFGVGEINITAQGDNEIAIELPNVKDSDEVKARIGKTALLEIKPVVDVARNKEEMLEKYGGQLPEGTIIVNGRLTKEHSEGVYLVPAYAELSGRSLKNAHYQQDMSDRAAFRSNPHAVGFELKPDGADKFYELTSKHVGERLAMLIDGEVICAPNVSNAIPGGQASISGNFTKKEAQDLAALLKSGAFVAPVKYSQERHIGPSLGQASIKKGLLSCVVALVLLFLFSVMAYKIAGLLAFIVLLFNLLLILFGLSALGATLSLPGIAGMVLTIGMAIDASILIFERIREELAVGTPAKKAVELGFSGAMAVILDANITHFLVSLVLYWLGSGPIQGFASSMIIGIVSTLVTGLILLKTLFNLMFLVFGTRSLKI